MIVKREELLRQLNQILAQVPANSPIMIHLDIATIGFIDSVSSKPLLMERYSSLFQEAFQGRQILFPTFNYGFFSKKEFNPQKDFSEIGIYPKYLSEKYPHLRTQTPVYNFVIFNNKNFNFKPVANCFGHHSSFDELFHQNGYVLRIGVLVNTFVHYTEEMNNIGYRYIKEFSGKLIHNEQASDMSVQCRVRPRGDVVQYSNIEHDEAISAGIMTEHQLGNTKAYLYPANEFHNFVSDKIKSDELYLLSEQSKLKVKELATQKGYPFKFSSLE